MLIKLWHSQSKGLTSNYVVPDAIWCIVGIETRSTVQTIPAAFIHLIPNINLDFNSFTAEDSGFWLTWLALYLLAVCFPEPYYSHLLSFIRIIKTCTGFSMMGNELRELCTNLYEWCLDYEDHYFQYDPKWLSVMTLTGHALDHLPDDIHNTGLPPVLWEFITEHSMGEVTWSVTLCVYLFLLTANMLLQHEQLKVMWMRYLDMKDDLDYSREHCNWNAISSAERCFPEINDQIILWTPGGILDPITTDPNLWKPLGADLGLAGGWLWDGLSEPPIHPNRLCSTIQRSAECVCITQGMATLTPVWYHTPCSHLYNTTHPAHLATCTLSATILATSPTPLSPPIPPPHHSTSQHHWAPHTNLLSSMSVLVSWHHSATWSSMKLMSIKVALPPTASCYCLHLPTSLCCPQCQSMVSQHHSASPCHLLLPNETNVTQHHPAGLSTLPVPLNPPAYPWDAHTSTQPHSLYLPLPVSSTYIILIRHTGHHTYLDHTQNPPHLLPPLWFCTIIFPSYPCDFAPLHPPTPCA